MILHIRIVMSNKNHVKKITPTQTLQYHHKPQFPYSRNELLLFRFLVGVLRGDVLRCGELLASGWFLGSGIFRFEHLNLGFANEVGHKTIITLQGCL